MQKPKVTIYTDGSWRSTTKMGGWASLIVSGPYWKIVSDKCTPTTVPRMELTSVIAGLEQLTVPCDVTVVSDSQLVVNTMNQWIHRWVKNGYRTSKKAPVLNQDLLVKLYEYMQIHTVNAVWIKAHTNNTDLHSLGNAVVDEFAQIQTR